MTAIYTPRREVGACDFTPASARVDYQGRTYYVIFYGPAPTVHVEFTRRLLPVTRRVKPGATRDAVLALACAARDAAEGQPNG